MVLSVVGMCLYCWVIFFKIKFCLSPLEPITVILGGPDMYIDVGSTINLTCIVKHLPDPPPGMYWTHNGVVSCCSLTESFFYYLYFPLASGNQLWLSSRYEFFHFCFDTTNEKSFMLMMLKNHAKDPQKHHKMRFEMAKINFFFCAAAVDSFIACCWELWEWDLSLLEVVKKVKQQICTSIN